MVTYSEDLAKVLKGAKFHKGTVSKGEVRSTLNSVHMALDREYGRFQYVRVGDAVLRREEVETKNKELMVHAINTEDVNLFFTALIRYLSLYQEESIGNLNVDEIKKVRLRLADSLVLKFSYKLDGMGTMEIK